MWCCRNCSLEEHVEESHITRTGVNNVVNPADCVASSCVTLPYVKDITEKVSRVLRRENIKVRYKPTTTLSQQFT